MNCHQMDTILDDHAVRSLSAAQRADVDAHLAKCARCANAWLGHEAVAGDFPGEPRPELFGEMAARTVAARSAPASRRFASWFGAVAAVLVVTVLAGYGVFRYAATPGTEADSRPAGETANSGAPAAKAAAYIAGRHYRVLATPVATGLGANKIQVAEFFMFGCEHCFSFEPVLDAWRERQPPYVELVRVPAVFNATAQLHARAFYTAEALGKLDEVRMPFYEEIHVRGNALANEGAVKAFFGRFGVDAKSFDAAFNSPGVAARVQHAAELNRQYGVSATPSIGVNGRYVTDPSMVDSGDLLDVVDTLVEASAHESCRERDSSICPVF